MIEPRSRRFLAWAAPAAGALMLAGAASAQVIAPPPYPPPHAVPQPPSPSEATAAPRMLPGTEAAALQSSQAAPAARTGGGAGISVSPLGEVEGPPTGTLDSTNGGLGSDLWSGSNRSTVEALMARLPIDTPVGSVRALARRLLLTKAAAPTGVADKAFMTVRIQRLLDGGLLDAAADLATMAQVQNDPGFARVQAEALLFDGRSEHVCDKTTAYRLDSAEPFWIELRAYCYATAGDDAALSLTRAVMNAQNIDDQTFDLLLDDIRHNVSKDPGSIANPTALDAYMLGQAGLKVGYDTGVQLGTPGLLLVVHSRQNAPEARLKAAERLVRTGALSPAELIAVADAQHFTEDQFATEYTQVAKLPFLAGQALLRQAVLRANPDAQPALIYEALSGAESKGLLGIAAVLQHGALAKLQPESDMRQMAGLMGRAVMLTGHANAASGWEGLLDPTLPSDQARLAKFQVILNLIAPTPARQAAAQQGLAELTREYREKARDQAFAALVLGLYDVLGQPLAPAAENAANAAMEMHWPGRRVAPSILRRLKDAIAAKGRRGEALLLGLDAIGPSGPGSLAPDLTVRLIRAIDEEGAPNAARDIAITALLRYNPPPQPLAAPPQQ